MLMMYQPAKDYFPSDDDVRRSRRWLLAAVGHTMMKIFDYYRCWCNIFWCVFFADVAADDDDFIDFSSMSLD